MAYFRNNETVTDQEYLQEQETENEYDDGFEEAEDEDVYPGMTTEERRERRQSRTRLAFGAGNLFGVIAGAVLILLLLTLIFSMVYFVINDMERNFSLFSTNF